MAWTLAQSATGAGTTSLVVSVLALAVAAASAALTYVQGQAIRKIETREHEWQAIDRRSAHLEVVRIHKDETRDAGGRLLAKSEDWIRLSNTGRAKACEVTWKGELTDETRSPLRTIRAPANLAVLHPGEHFDIKLSKDPGQEPTATFTVEWSDGNGQHSTTRLLNV